MSNLNPGGLTRVLNYIKTWVTGLLNDKANSSHSHTKSQITDFPTIPSKTSQLSNDSGFLTAHQSLSNYSTLANTVKSLSISGKTITVTPGSGSTYTLTTQDTVYTHPTTAGNKHIPSGGSANQYLKYSASGTAVWANLPTIPSKTSQLTNDSGFLTSHQSLANYVTLNTAQTISGNKTFSGLTKTSGKVGYDTAGNDVNNAIYNMETTTWGPDTANKPSSNYGTLLSLNREVNVHTSAGVGWIVQFGIGTDTRLYLRTKTNIGGDWSGWREFSDIGHTHTKSQITDFPTIPSNTSQLTNDSGYITSSGSCNYANSSGNADTLDGSHAWQMQTLNSSGGVHGSNDWLMQCQYNVDGDGYFKLYCGDRSIGTKVDRASSAGYADSAGWANSAGSASSTSSVSFSNNGQCSISAGGADCGDAIDSQACNLAIRSWWSIGFYDQCFNKYAISMDVRNGIVRAYTLRAENSSDKGLQLGSYHVYVG